MRYFVGTYSQPVGKIFEIRLDTSLDRLQILREYEVLPNPSFLAVRSKHLYSVSEQSGQGHITAYKVSKDKELRAVSQVSVPYAGLCHLSMWPDGTAVSAASYLDGGFLTCAVLSDGVLQQDSCQWFKNDGSSVHPERQKQSHAHCIMPDRRGNFFIGADLGTDQLLVFHADNRSLSLRHKVSVSSGEGPRHLVFHPSNRFAYLVTEMGNKVVSYRFDDESGLLTEIGVYPMLEDKQILESLLAADIHITPDGRFLIASTRGKNYLVRFTVSADGKLAERAHIPCGAEHVRGFCISASGEHLIVADELGDKVNLLRFSTDTGTVSDVLDSLSIPQPTCVISAKSSS